MTLKVKVKFHHIQSHPRCNLRKMQLLAKFGDPRFNPWKVIAWTSSGFFADFDLSDPKLPWRSRSNPVIYNPIRDLPMMHLLAKFGDPSLNPSKVIARTSPFFANFDIFDPKWPWRSRSKFCRIQSHPRSTQDAPIGQIWWPLASILQKLSRGQARYLPIFTFLTQMTLKV